MQVLRADLVIQDPECKMNMQEPGRSLLKPEVVWQLEKGFQPSPEQVGQRQAEPCSGVSGHCHWRYLECLGVCC